IPVVFLMIGMTWRQEPSRFLYIVEEALGSSTFQGNYERTDKRGCQGGLLSMIRIRLKRGFFSPKSKRKTKKLPPDSTIRIFVDAPSNMHPASIREI
ncbi:MAG TPA: hypothetical protein PKD05_23705, partial [Candidatus Melainabacteria bacterium]|nr:hypothetical protein [Candidatus Melainabacteria bacterium]